MEKLSKTETLAALMKQGMAASEATRIHREPDRQACRFKTDAMLAASKELVMITATKSEMRELYFALMIRPSDEDFERIWREMERERIDAAKKDGSHD